MVAGLVAKQSTITCSGRTQDRPPCQAHSFFEDLVMKIFLQPISSKKSSFYIMEKIFALSTC